MIGSTATGIGNNKAVIGNASVTDVYMAQDGEAIVHAASISFSDGTSQTTAVSGSVSPTLITPGMLKLRGSASYVDLPSYNRPAYQMEDGTTTQTNISIPIPSAFASGGGSITIKVLYSTVATGGNVYMDLGIGGIALGEFTTAGYGGPRAQWAGSSTAYELKEYTYTTNLPANDRHVLIMIGRRGGDSDDDNTGVLHILGAEIVW